MTRGISIAVSPFIAIFKNSAYQNGIFAIAHFYSNDTPSGPKKQAPAAGPKGGFELIFHIAVCSPDSVLRSRVERQCLDYYARRDDACIVEQLDGPEAPAGPGDTPGSGTSCISSSCPARRPLRRCGRRRRSAAGDAGRRWPFWPTRPPTPTAPTGWTPCSIYCCPSRPSS